MKIVFGETVLDNKGNGISEPIDAQYSPSEKKLTLRTGSYPTILQMTEEMYHAYQDMNNVLVNSKYNVEFEAKTIALVVAGESFAPNISTANGIPQSYKDDVYIYSGTERAVLTKYLNDNYVRNGVIFSKYWRHRNNYHYSAPVKFVPQLLKNILQ